MRLLRRRSFGSTSSSSVQARLRNLPPTVFLRICSVGLWRVVLPKSATTGFWTERTALYRAELCFHQKASAQTYTLKYDQANDNYSLTLTDTNNTLRDVKFSSGSGITVTRSGNKYTFTSGKMIENPVSITAQKVIPNSLDNMLIWGCPGKQTMTSGAADPVYFYLNIKTETTGIGHIVKHSEDGKVDGIRFTITGNGVNQTVTTKSDGTVDIELMPGVYTVTEETIDKYVPQNTQRVTIVSGGTSTVTFSNVLKRGGLKVIKTSEDNLNEGVKFHLYGTSSPA